MTVSPNQEIDRAIGLPDQAHRKAVLQIMLITATVLWSIFGFINWPYSRELAIAELVLAAYSLLLVPISRKPEYLVACSLAFLIPVYGLILYACSLPQSADTVFVWSLVIPVLSHLMLGRWYGLWLSIVALLGSLTIYLYRFHDQPQFIGTAALANVVLSGAAILLFAHVYEVSRTRAQRKLLYLATTDSLTTLANRTRFLDVFERERNHAQRSGGGLSLLILDLDHFKLVNDRYGHDVGDEVLKYVAAAISQRLRKTDLACRLGGEEFGVLLPGANLQQAVAVAEDIRRSIADVPYTREDIVIPLSVSIGAAEFDEDGSDLETLYAVADNHLYKAKKAGRNLVHARQLYRTGELPLEEVSA